MNRVFLVKLFMNLRMSRRLQAIIDPQWGSTIIKQLSNRAAYVFMCICNEILYPVSFP